MPGKRSPGIPARGFFNTKLEDIAEVCPFGAKLSAARREKCCGGRAGTGLGGRVLPRSPVLAAASFPGDRFRRPRPSPGARSRRPRPSPEPGFGGRVLSGDRLPPCSAFRSRSAGLPLPDGEGRGRVPLPCPFRAPSVPRRGGRGTDGEQTGNGRGWTAAEVSRRNGAAPFPARFLPRCGFRIAKIRPVCVLPMRPFPDPALRIFVRNSVFLTGKSWRRVRVCSFRNNRVSICSRAFPCPDMCVPISARRRRCRIIKRFLYNIRCALPRFPILRLPFDSRSPPFRQMYFFASSGFLHPCNFALFFL